MKILGVRIDNFSRKEVLEKIERFLDGDRFHQIATVNPEFILQAQKDEHFRDILNKSNLNVADGVGIRYAFLRHFALLKAKIAGADLLDEILKIGNKKGLTIFLAISKNSLSPYEEIKLALEDNFQGIQICGENIDPLNSSSYKIQDTKCEIVLCNFGSPMQEKFINSVKNDTIRLAMGVGGSFDFLTGKVKRAPKLMRYFGLEWLYRFIQEPKYRFKRIFNAVIIFPCKIIFSK